MKIYREEIQKVIDIVYKGDAKAFERDHSNGRKDLLKWDDIIADTEVFPEHALASRGIIKLLLGYYPNAHVTLPFEPSIRALLNSHFSGGISYDELVAQTEIHVKHMRNEEIHSHSCLTYEDAIYKKYEDYLPEYQDLVCNRLTGFLGYKPGLETSAVVEILLRENHLNDRYHFPDDKITSVEVQAITIIKYREVLLEQGKAAADASPLIARIL